MGERVELPHHKVGTHRPILFKDLLTFEKIRNTRRREALDRLREEAEKAGQSFSDDTGDE